MLVVNVFQSGCTRPYGYRLQSSGGGVCFASGEGPYRHSLRPVAQVFHCILELSFKQIAVTLERQADAREMLRLMSATNNKFVFRENSRNGIILFWHMCAGNVP